jgi:ADP-ribose pyrophosphatase YjhB (NUDIX family)
MTEDRPSVDQSNNYKNMKISAQVVLINPDGLILGVSRKDNHNDFGLIGGKKEDIDNTPEDTAIRETFEETGLRISNLRLVLAIHKHGFMSYTYLADYEGEINHNEPHIVKWLPMQRLVLGSFGKYNKLVCESLLDMGISFQYKISLDELVKDIKEFLDKTTLRGLHLSYEGLRKDSEWLDDNELTLYLKYSDGSYIDEDFPIDVDDKFTTSLMKIGEPYGFNIRIPYYYYGK